MTGDNDGVATHKWILRIQDASFASVLFCINEMLIPLGSFVEPRRGGGRR